MTTLPPTNPRSSLGKFTVRCFLVPFVFLAEKDVACTLLFDAIVYTV